MNAQQLVNAQNQVDLGKIPIWYGDKKKDVFIAEHWFDRIHMAKVNAPWTDLQAKMYFFQALRGDAVLWWNVMLDARVDLDTWDILKMKFLETFGTTMTERTAVANVRLQQGATEACMIFAGRVTMAMRELKASQWTQTRVPTADLDVHIWGTAAGAMPADFWGAGATGDRKRRIMDNLKWYQSEFEKDNFGRTVFIAGLRKELREELMKNTIKLPYLRTVELASHIERQLTDPSKTVTHITEVENNEQIDAVQRNRKNNSKNQNFANRSRPSGSSTNSTFSKQRTTLRCYYCNKTGHTQPKCFKRKREKGQWKDKDGKPWIGAISEVNADFQLRPDQEDCDETLQHIATTENALSSIEQQLFNSYNVYDSNYLNFH